MDMSFARVRDALVAIAEELERNRQHYNDLDSPIGDSDHGDSVCGAFRKVREAALQSDPAQLDIGELLKSAGRAITFAGGGAMGPLYGTAFMEAGKCVAGKSSISYDELVRMWGAFADGVARRGGVKLGEKTMYDTIRPAVDALEKAHAEGVPMREACALAVEAAEKGMNSTREMLSQRGRSSRLGERSLGHVDPGAASAFAILSVFFQAAGIR
jgi:dihydroxyacetone kinase-like protein